MLLILLVLIIIVNCLNINKVSQVKPVLTAKNVKIMVRLKYLSNFWRNLEMPLINCEIYLILTWSPNCFISSNTPGT